MDNDYIFKFLTRALLLFTAMPVHECAHAWVAEKLGDDTGRKKGRITLNPFAHLDLMGSLMMFFAGFGWGKPVPVDPNNFKNRKKGMMLSALAGPAANFIMAYLSMIVCKLFMVASAVSGKDLMLAARVFIYITLINISLGVFNFLPIPPLDGSKIFNSILPEKWYFAIMKYERYIVIAVLVLVYTGLLDTPLGFLQEKVFDVMDFLTGWVDAIFMAAMG